MHKESPAIIRLARKKSDIKMAREFIEKMNLKYHGCRPPTTPEIVFMAKRDNSVIGTIALDFNEFDKQFRIETHFVFHYNQTPFPFEREKIAQFGRWITTSKDISIPLMYVATLYSLMNGKLYALTELKGFISDYVKKLGWQIYPIPYSKLLIDFIDPAEQHYYLTQPNPQPVMADLKEKETALKTRTMELIFDGKVILDFS